MSVWYQDPITQAHGVNGEQGVDLGTPFHTQLTEILGGTVQRVECSLPWACEIDVATTFQGQPVVEGYLHVDEPMVSAGQVLSPGEMIGLSGGEINSLPGAQHIDSPSVSTGPHTEYDIWQGTSPWRNALDPTSVVQAGPAGGVGVGGIQLPNPIGLLGGIAGEVVTQASGSLPGLNINVDPFSNLGQQIGSGFSSLGNWVHDRVLPFAGVNVIALAVAVVVILIVLGTGSSQNQGGGGPELIPVPV